MTEIIDKLTPEQEKMLSVIRDKWIAIGLETDSNPDKSVVEAHLKDAYTVAGCKPPRSFFWAPSPLKGCEYASILEEYEGDYDPKVLVPFVENAVANWNGRKYSEGIWSIFYGSFEFGWLASYDYFLSVLGFECCKKLVPLAEVSKAVGWVWLFEDAVVITRRPIELHLTGDSEKRLHNLNGPAVLYADGMAIYAIDGVEVTKEIVERTFTCQDIADQENVERRRIMIDQFGRDRYLTAIGAKKVHEDEFGILYEVRQPDDDVWQFVKVQNSTPEPDGTYKSYVLGVEGQTTARGAVASTFGLTAEEYEPVTET